MGRSCGMCYTSAHGQVKHGRLILCNGTNATVRLRVILVSDVRSRVVTFRASTRLLRMWSAEYIRRCYLVNLSYASVDV